MEKISGLIAWHRKRLGLTQVEFSKKIGISHPTLVKIENGSNGIITISVGKKMAEVFGLSFNDLFEIETHTVKHETDKLKALVLQSLVKYVNDQIFLKQFEHNEENPADWEKFELYRDHLQEFKKGFIQMLVNVGFCTSEDITEFYDWLHDRGKYKKEK